MDCNSKNFNHNLFFTLRLFLNPLFIKQTIYMNFLASKNTSQALLSKTITTTKHLWIQSSCFSTLVIAQCMSDVSVCFQTQKPGNVCFSTEKHWAMEKVEKVGTSGRGWKTFNSKSLFSPVSLASMMWLKGLLLEHKDRATPDWPLTGCVPLVTYHLRSLNNSLSISRAWWIWGAHFSSIVNLGLPTEMVLSLKDN